MVLASGASGASGPRAPPSHDSVLGRDGEGVSPLAVQPDPQHLASSAGAPPRLPLKGFSFSLVGYRLSADKTTVCTLNYMP